MKKFFVSIILSGLFMNPVFAKPAKPPVEKKHHKLFHKGPKKPKAPKKAK